MEVESIPDDPGSSAGIGLSDAKEYITILDHEIDRLNRIVTQLLSFVRPKQPIMAKVRLDDILPWCMSMLKTSGRKSRA